MRNSPALPPKCGATPSSVLEGYAIDDRATLRQLEGELAQLDFLDGKYDEALQRAARIKELQDKPADKLMSGVQLRAMIAAQRKAGDRTSDAYRSEAGRLIGADLAQMPYEVVQNDVKEAKAGAEIASESLTLGYLRNVIQPTVDKAGALSSDLAPAVVNAKYRLVASLPLKQTLVATYSSYLAAHKVDKPDIWAARDVEPAVRETVREGQRRGVGQRRRREPFRRPRRDEERQARRDRVRSLRKAR